MSRPDQCPMCGSLNFTALNADGTRYDPFLKRAAQIKLHGQTFWELCKCDECGAVWPFRIVQTAEQESDMERGRG